MRVIARRAFSKSRRVSIELKIRVLRDASREKPSQSRAQRRVIQVAQSQPTSLGEGTTTTIGLQRLRHEGTGAADNQAAPARRRDRTTQQEAAREGSQRTMSTTTSHKPGAPAQPPAHPRSFHAMFLDEGCGPQYTTTYDHDRAYRNPHITEEPVPGTGGTPTIMTTVSADNMLVKPHLSPTKERPMKKYVGSPKAKRRFWRGPEEMGRRKFPPPATTVPL